MIFNREKAQKTQKREGMVSSAFPSRLRAFAPSCENKKAWPKSWARGSLQSFAADRTPGAKPSFVPLPHEERKLWENLKAGWPWHAFGFSREGAKVRRREGKRFEELAGLSGFPILRLSSFPISRWGANLCFAERANEIGDFTACNPPLNA